jgi:hypothetical protein
MPVVGEEVDAPSDSQAEFARGDPGGGPDPGFRP